MRTTYLVANLCFQQPEKSEAEEQATELFSDNSSLFHEILFVLLQTLGAAVLCGLVWEAIRKLRARRKKVLPGKSVSQSVGHSVKLFSFNN